MSRAPITHHPSTPLCPRAVLSSYDEREARPGQDAPRHHAGARGEPSTLPTRNQSSSSSGLLSLKPTPSPTRVLHQLAHYCLACHVFVASLPYRSAPRPWLAQVLALVGPTTSSPPSRISPLRTLFFAPSAPPHPPHSPLHPAQHLPRRPLHPPRPPLRAPDRASRTSLSIPPPRQPGITCRELSCPRRPPSTPLCPRAVRNSCDEREAHPCQHAGACGEPRTHSPFQRAPRLSNCLAQVYSITSVLSNPPLYPADKEKHFQLPPRGVPHPHRRQQSLPWRKPPAHDRVQLRKRAGGS